MDCSMPGFPVHLQLPELPQTHGHRVGDAIQPSHPLPSFSPFAFILAQHQGSFPMSQLFASGGQSIGASASVLPVNTQCWTPRSMLCVLTVTGACLGKAMEEVIYPVGLPGGGVSGSTGRGELFGVGAFQGGLFILASPGI